MDEKKKKYLIIFSSIASVILLYYVLFTSEAPLDKPQKNPQKGGGDLASLLSSSSSKANTNRNGEIITAQETSLFEEDGFFDTTGFEEENDTGNHPIPQGEAPVNPQTGKPYPAEAMRQFDSIRKLMPDNDLIPRRMTPSQKEEKKRKTAANLKITQKVNTNKASQEEAEQHFQNQEKVLKDRLQIINYLIEKQEEEGFIDEDGKFKKVLEGTKKQIKALSDRRTNYMKKFQPEA
ncbi:MAG: hypothetical protein AAF518_23045 [Spirochaetota bacterium]